MKATLIIDKRDDGYVLDLFSDRATKRGERCGLTPEEAARAAARYLAQLTFSGATLMAPAEVYELVPAHLRDIEGEVTRARAG